MLFCKELQRKPPLNTENKERYIPWQGNKTKACNYHVPEQGMGLQNKGCLMAAAMSHLNMKTTLEAPLCGLFSNHAAVPSIHISKTVFILMLMDFTAWISE